MLLATSPTLTSASLSAPSGEPGNVPAIVVAAAALCWTHSIVECLLDLTCTARPHPRAIPEPRYIPNLPLALHQHLRRLGELTEVALVVA